MPALEPGQFDEMIEDARRALYHVMPDKAKGTKGGLAITLIRVLMHAAEERVINQQATELSVSPVSRGISLGVVTQCNRTIHDVYFQLYEQGLIPDDLPEQVAGNAL